jgi:hypothetical protein
MTTTPMMTNIASKRMTPLFIVVCLLLVNSSFAAALAADGLPPPPDPAVTLAQVRADAHKRLNMEMARANNGDDTRGNPTLVNAAMQTAAYFDAMTATQFATLRANKYEPARERFLKHWAQMTPDQQRAFYAQHPEITPPTNAAKM